MSYWIAARPSEIIMQCLRWITRRSQDVHQQSKGVTITYSFLEYLLYKQERETQLGDMSELRASEFYPAFMSSNRVLHSSSKSAWFGTIKYSRKLQIIVTATSSSYTVFLNSAWIVR